MATRHHLRRPVIAKSISLYRPRECALEPCRLPLPFDENFIIAVEYNTPNESSGSKSSNRKEFSHFLAKYNLFTPEELQHTVKANEVDLYNLLSRSIPCVGCRRSVEQLYAQLIDFNIPALEPVTLSSDGFISLKPDYIRQPELLFALFRRCGFRLNDYIEAIPKMKKSRRCIMHSLDSHKLRPMSSWLDVWDLMEPDCREEAVIIEQEVLLETLETHLKKHRFCGECKSKVLLAYDLLVQNVDPKKEKEFAASLYDGIRYCSEEKHIHVKNNTDFVAKLLSRIEPEVKGRQKHAKTVDVAQEEILMCIGECLCNRFLQIDQRIREDGQTWQTLFLLCAECLNTSFEIGVEMKRGYSQLDLLCTEMTITGENKLEKRASKRQKRRSKKNKILEYTDIEWQCTGYVHAKDESCGEDVVSHSRSASPHSTKSKDNCLLQFVKKSSASNFSTFSSRISPVSSHRMSPCSCCDGDGIGCCTESGYSSGSVNDNTWNCSSSCNGSETTSSDNCCIFEDDFEEVICNKRSTRREYFCRDSRRNVHSGRKIDVSKKNGLIEGLSSMSSMPHSLERLLKTFCPSAEDSYISPDELREMKAKVCQSAGERVKLRENLKRRFASLQRRSRFQFRPLLFRKVQPTI